MNSGNCSVAQDGNTNCYNALSRRQVRSVYLITYSRAQANIIASRAAFAEVIVDTFNNADPKISNRVLQWVCSQEQHGDWGIHYHMAVKLERNGRWLKIRNYVDEKHGMKINFSSNHTNYYSAWKYATKDDTDFVQSEGHPDLGNVPQTQQASRARAKGSGSKKKISKRPRTPRLSVYDVSQIAVSKGIKTRVELLAFANEQKKSGKTDLAEFVANRGYRAVEDALKVGWEIEEAPRELERASKTRLEILQAFAHTECVAGCNRQWLNMARDILFRNGIPESQFCEAVKSLLIKGRGKYRNILIKGPANCGKTFIIDPLNSIYRTFANPATTTFAWVGAQNAEIMFLNDFRWSEKVIPWHDLLLLLEGQTVHLPAPKCNLPEDIKFVKDTPIFCTMKEDLVYVRGGALDERETEMMRVPWKIFNFHAQIPHSEQVDILPCPHCFAELLA